MKGIIVSVVAAGLISWTTLVTNAIPAPTGQSPQAAVNQGVAAAAADGFDEHVSVRDRNTGQLLAQTPDANTPVASESLVKLFTATYDIVHNHGSYLNTSAADLAGLAYMIEYSDDKSETARFTFNDVPWVVQRYGLSANTNNGPNPWGAVSMTANDETLFLYKMLKDPAIGPWLGQVMSQVKPHGSDGFDQHFGFNALSGVHGSKQGWGMDNWTGLPDAIHSIGYTDKYVGAILSTGNSASYHTMEAPDTNTAQLIQASIVNVNNPKVPAATATTYVTNLLTSTMGSDVKNDSDYQTALNSYESALELGNQSEAQVATSILGSTARLNSIVDTASSACLGRPATLAELSASAATLVSGNLDTLYASLCGSDEAYTLGSSNPTTWAYDAIVAMLGRPATPAEEKRWSTYEAAHGRVAAAKAIADTAEFGTYQLNLLYKQFLGHAADAGAAAQARAMSGRGIFTVAQSIATGPEFAAKS